MQQLIEQLGMNDRQGPPLAPRPAIDALPTVKITQRLLNIDSQCSVCQDNFELGSEARQIPCQHLYHSDCIIRWLVRHNSCPLCRLELPSEASGSAPGNWNARTGNVSSGSHNSSSRRETSSQNQGSRNRFTVAGRRLVWPFDSSNQNTGNWNARTGNVSSGSHNSSSRETSSQNQGSRNPFAVAGRQLVWPFDSSNQNTGNLSERGGGSSSTTPYEENNETNYPRDAFNS